MMATATVRNARALARVTALMLAAVMVGTLAGSVVLLRQIDRMRSGATLEEVLYIPSPKVLKLMSLGYTGLMADIYWTRVIQYFGTKHRAKASEYRLLAPLLEITTALDPHLIVAYRFGSTFLAQQPPEGAGDPKAAVQFIERGISENPDTWQLYYELGFLKYMELHDPAGAAQAFERGSKIAHPHPFLKVLAAAMAQHAGERDLARMLWLTTYQTTDDALIQDNAVKHLRALDVEDEITRLDKVLETFQARTGRSARSWVELVQAGYLRAIPVDPFQHPYKLVDGHVEVTDPKALPFLTKGLPPDVKPQKLPIETIVPDQSPE